MYVLCHKSVRLKVFFAKFSSDLPILTHSEALTENIDQKLFLMIDSDVISTWQVSLEMIIMSREYNQHISREEFKINEEKNSRKKNIEISC